MKSKTILAFALSAAFSSAVIAGDKQVFYSEASEENPIRATLDMKTGGYKGWGPMANPDAGFRDQESTVQRDQDLIKDRKQHVAEVYQEQQRVWVANNDVRNEEIYGEMAVGGTSTEGGGFLFFRGR